jgi:hypothetical protein
MIYIDDCVWKKPKGRESYAHMVADTHAELHAFAEKIGLGRHFFHKSSKVQHYDVSSKFYRKAIEAGAQLTSRAGFLAHGKAMMLFEQMKDMQQ